MKSGFAEKQFFKLRKIVFFAHAWTASNPRRIYMWIDLGTWNIVSPITWRKLRLCRNIVFGPCNDSDKLHARCDCERQTTGNQENDILTDAFRCPKSAPPGFDHYATGTLPLRHFAFSFSFSLSLPWLQLAGFSLGCSCEKTIFKALKICVFCIALMIWNSEKPGFAKKQCFQALKKCFFPHCSYETHRLCNKTFFQALYGPIFFSHASCQICQLHLVTSFKLAPNCADACNT